MSQDPKPATQPEGQLVLRTMAMPSDTNPSGDIFGGWLMSQMDIGGGILAHELAQGHIVTVAVEKITFYLPVKVGDVVCCYGKCVRVGNSSLQINVEVWVRKPNSTEAERARVTSAVFTYVAIDDTGRPRPISRENNPILTQALQELAA